MLQEWPAGGLAPLERLRRYRHDRDLGRRLRLDLVFLEFHQLQLELVEQRAAFRRLAEPLVPQLRYGVLQLLDLQRPLVRLRFRTSCCLCRPARTKFDRTAPKQIAVAQSGGDRVAQLQQGVMR